MNSLNTKFPFSQSLATTILFCLYESDYPGTSCKYNSTIFFLCNWLISLSIMSSWIVYVGTCIRIYLPVQDWMKFHISIYGILSVKGTLGLFQPVGYWYEHVCINIFLSPYFSSLGYIPQNGFFVSYGNSMFNSLRNPHTLFYLLSTIPPGIHQGSSFFTSLLTLIFFSCLCLFL